MRGNYFSKELIETLIEFSMRGNYFTNTKEETLV
jgi:hypothetical protein